MMNRYLYFTAAAFFLSLSVILLEAVAVSFSGKEIVILILLFMVPVSFLTELGIRLRASIRKSLFLRKNLPDFITLAIFLAVFAVTTWLSFSTGKEGYRVLSLVFVLIRNGYLLGVRLVRMRKLTAFIGSFSRHPAQTLALSFLIVILSGSILLMLPFSTPDKIGLAPLDAFFTATSAVCVTGLIVVDTATAFTFWGKLIILVLIQLGGLGIMLSSYFIIFFFRRSMSVEEKLLISYMLSENDMTRLRRTLMSIVFITFSIESIGALALFPAFYRNSRMLSESILNSVFHSVSAFCNAGFALFSDSLESFSGNPEVIITIASLIIIGGLSFSVILNLIGEARQLIREKTGKAPVSYKPLPPNTKVVLAATAFLLVAGTFLTYGLEHSNTLRSLPLGRQYMNAFFQSVTYRTAGFNTLPFGDLKIPTYFIIILFMFIGGASGSTAGGIKVNTAVVILNFIRSAFRGKEEVTVYQHRIAFEVVTRAFLILILGLTAVFTGTVILTITEKAPLVTILFETVSAFATVGLSAGLTPALSPVGKLVIILLMYIGRTGPLTLVAAAAIRKGLKVNYPIANIAIG